jgi:D-serine deaminase-like pyridoxal phosphate-dependent protein
MQHGPKDAQGRRSRGRSPATREDLPTPALVVDLDRFDENVRRAAALVSGTGKVLRPHIKAHRTPALGLRQLGPVAPGVTCATVGEAEAMVASGIEDVLLANEIVTSAKISRFVALAHEAQIGIAVDSRVGVALLATAAHKAGVTISVLIDLDVGIHRCGVRSIAKARDLARQVASASGLRLRGVMGYEGRLRAAEPDRAERIAAAYAVLAMARDSLARDGHDMSIVSSAGTSTLSEALADPTITEMQAGTYAVMESDLDDLGLPFEPSVEIVGTVMSRSRDRAILDVGKKSVACDYGLPVAASEQATTVSTHEEHTTLAWDGRPPKLGSKLSLRPLHVRLTFNLHDVVWLVRGDEVLDRVPISARGKSS